ncbi:organic solvent tolerance protein [Novosphingobium sp. Fuku2-ISO-50]|nr:organic solvent tolerance protein [Novosphingobium sp. Fuku2-ISO-50]
MRPLTRPQPQAFSMRLRARRSTACLALLGMTGLLPAFEAAHAAAPAADSPPAAPADPQQAAPDAKTEPAATDLVRFAADKVSYDHDTDVITASGNVVMRRDAQSLRAETVTWNRKTGAIQATGNIRFVDEDGDVLYGDHIDLTDQFKAGATQDLLLVLREGGRMAARSGERDDAGRIVLHQVAYSGCEVVDDAGCPRQPSWELTAVRVAYDPEKKTVRYYGAKLRVFGVPLLPLPGLSHPSDFRAASGFLIPTFSLSSSNGAEISNTFYWRLAANRDLSVTGTLFSKSLPMVSAHYRQLTDKGAFQVNGYLTYSRQTDAATNANGGLVSAGNGDFTMRGYLEANGRFELGNDWSLTASGRYVSDRTFLLRYDLSSDTRLRSTFNLEHINQDSYFSFAGWAIQAIGTNDFANKQPLALPSIDYRQRFDMPGVGGKLEVEVNSLALTRTNGQDTQRALARAQWDLRTITSGGQVLTLTALLRGDIYHSSDNLLTTNPIYQGLPGWQARGIATIAADVKWPFAGEFLGGTQVLTPEVQFVATPRLRNLAIPDEDSRAIELETDNIFSLNRYPGYDRVGDGLRVTYGVDWRFDRPGWRASATLAQSYRSFDETSIVPVGTGLATRFSDVVGRAEVRFRDIVQLTERFQLDKATFQLRRNEFDATIGSHRTYVEIGYIALNRSIPLSYEDLQDSKELRVSARAAFAHYWSLFGSGIVNLTSKADNPVNGANGFQMIRHRLGLAYTDGCLDLAFTWRRDYVTTGDAVRGNSYALTLSLKNIGTR